MFWRKAALFVRAVSAYDTLLQMGRWFGYRNHYGDLPRIWMTDELREWFAHLATVEAESASGAVGSESSWMPTKPPTAIPSAKTRFQVPALRQS